MVNYHVTLNLLERCEILRDGKRVAFPVNLRILSLLMWSRSLDTTAQLLPKV